MSLSSPLFVLLATVPLVATLLLGAQLKPAYLHELIGRPRALVVGLAGQLLLLPLIAAIFCSAYPAPPHVKAGWFILASVPGGMLSNTITFVGRGRLSLSVVLTACSTVAGVVTIPLWINVGVSLAGGEGGQELPTASMVGGSFVILVIPLAIGIAIGGWRPALAERLREPTRRTLLVLLVVGGIAYLGQRWTFIVGDFSLVTFIGAALFHAVAVLGSWSVARAVGLDRRDSFTVGIEVGVQNMVIGLLVVELLGRSDLVPFVGYYGLMMLVLGFGWMALLGGYAAPSGSGARASSRLEVQ